VVAGHGGGVALIWSVSRARARAMRRLREARKPRDLGDAIRAVREARGISQEELAQANAYDRGSTGPYGGLVRCRVVPGYDA
jgi:hypothetical protein